MAAFNILGKGTAENTYDAIVIGSGITGGIAAKELTEAGLTVLVLERGRMVEHIKDYPTALTDPWDLPLRNLVSLDEQKNYEAIRGWSGQTRGLEELNVPVEALARISAMYSFQNIQAAVSLHHGTADALVPLDWSVQTCDQLTSLGKNVECIYYQDMPHTFYGSGDEEFIQNTVRFFNQYLKAP